MKIDKGYYKYIGYNGTFTTKVIINGANPPPMKLVQLIADIGKVLTNGEKKVHAIMIPEEEIKQWTEIDNIEE